MFHICFSSVFFNVPDPEWISRNRKHTKCDKNAYMFNVQCSSDSIVVSHAKEISSFAGTNNPKSTNKNSTTMLCEQCYLYSVCLYFRLFVLYHFRLHFVYDETKAFPKEYVRFLGHRGITKTNFHNIFDMQKEMKLNIIKPPNEWDRKTNFRGAMRECNALDDTQGKHSATRFFFSGEFVPIHHKFMKWMSIR